MELKETFNHVIHDYEYARPHYPPQLFSDIADFTKHGEVNFAGHGKNDFAGHGENVLSGTPATIRRDTWEPAAQVACAVWRGADILEVGAGTGQATAPFAHAGARLTLLELGAEQAAYLAKKFPEARSVCTPFEAFDAEGNSFDLIFSATAFHWIPAELGYPKARRLLRPGGTLAVFWHNSSVTHFTDAMHSRIRALCRPYSPTLYEGLTPEGFAAVHEKRLRQIACGFSQPPVCRDYRWLDVYDADRYVALLNSYSDFQLLEEAARKALLYEIRACIESNGGAVEVPQHVRLYLVRKED